MKSIALTVLLLCLTACGTTHNKELPMVKRSDPIVRLNADRWGEQVNNLTTIPGTPR